MIIPKLTFLMMCRIRTDLKDNSISDIFSFFDSAIKYIPIGERPLVEFLVKFDNDDKIAKSFNLNKLYPSLNIRTFTYGRWEGQATNHYHFSYLFSHRNPNSKYIGFVSDDCQFTRFNINELIGEYSYFNTKHTLKKLEEFKDYKNNLSWITGLNDSYPIMSAKILEITSGIGFQEHIDNWKSLLNLILYSKYKISLSRIWKPIFKRHNILPEKLRKDLTWYDWTTGSKFNYDMKLFIEKDKVNSYYFTLVEKQAHNIYLNLKEDGVLQNYKIK